MSCRYLPWAPSAAVISSCGRGRSHSPSTKQPCVHGATSATPRPCGSSYRIADHGARYGSGYRIPDHRARYGHQSLDIGLRLVVDRCEAHIKELLGWQRGDLFRESSGDWQQDDCGSTARASATPTARPASGVTPAKQLMAPGKNPPRTVQAHISHFLRRSFLNFS